MAYKVGGTEVISNARALNNITAIDSTTASAIQTAGIGGAATWKTIATISDSTTRTSSYESPFTQVTMPSTAVTGFGVVFDCDGQITTTGSYNWEVHIALSTNNSWTANGGIGNQANFANPRNTSGYWPATNQWQNIQFAGIIGVDGGSLNMDYSSGHSTTTKPRGRNISIFELTNPASSLARVEWDGDYWANYGIGGFTSSDAPPLTPNSTFYTGFWFDRYNRTGVQIRNVSLKIIGLY
jgi:hypothetical protein